MDKLAKTLLFLFLLILVITPSPTLAKKKLGTGAKKATTVSKSTSKGITTRVSFRGDRRAVVATFSNLGIVSKVDYFLTYQSRGTTQGASGTLTSASEDPTSRELLFGTCSRGVCRYDSGIANAKLTVTTRLKNGAKVIKNFRLKV